MVVAGDYLAYLNFPVSFSSGLFMVTVRAVPCRSRNRNGLDSLHEAQAPTAEMAETPPSIRKSAPTTYAESSDAR